MKARKFMNKSKIVLFIIGTIVIALIIIQLGLESERERKRSKEPVAEEVSLDTAPLKISNIRVSNITKNSATISWETNKLSTAMVIYSSDPPQIAMQRELHYEFSGPEPTTSHSITISDLWIRTTYYYSVSSTDTSGNHARSEELEFTTLW